MAVGKSVSFRNATINEALVFEKHFDFSYTQGSSTTF